jgi:hypothetical protein
MLSNQELMEIAKAVITSTSLQNGGKLNPKQANRFLDYVVDETSMGGVVRTERFRNEEMLLEKIGVGRRVAVPKEEASDPGIRRGVSTSKVVLKPVEIMVPFEIGDLFKDINIEGDNIEDHIVKMMARQLANNLEELYWEGNTNGPAVLEGDIIEGGSPTLYRKDTYLALFDGWLKTAEGANVVDAQNAEISQAVFGKALRAMPTKFKRQRGKLRWFLSDNHEQAYREGLSHRATMLGDSAVNAADSPRPFGVPMMPVALLPENPLYSEDAVMNTDGTTATALSYAPITDLVVIQNQLDKIPEAAYVDGVDYSKSLSAGTVTRLGGAIGSGETTKCTYRTAGRMLLSDPKNLILAIGRDIRIEKDRNIYKTVNEFAITAKVYCTFEELSAAVLVKNIKVPE